MNFSKTLSLIGLGTLAPAIVFAQSVATGIPEGAYQGRLRGTVKGKIHLITRKVKGCQGCFVATLIRRNHNAQQIKTYKAVPNNALVVGTEVTSTQYTLTPFGVDADGELTTPKDDPSLVLNINDEIGTTDVRFSIASAQSENKSGFQMAMIFKGKGSRIEAELAQNGRYKEAWVCQEVGTIGIVGQNLEDGSRSAQVTWNGSAGMDSGTYYLKEKAPGVFTFTGVSYLATGTQLKTMPTKIVVFVSIGGRERALLVNPNDSMDFQELKIMNK